MDALRSFVAWSEYVGSYAPLWRTVSATIRAPQGGILMHGKRGTLAERFWAKVNKDGPVPEHRPDLGPCWI